MIGIIFYDGVVLGKEFSVKHARLLCQWSGPVSMFRFLLSAFRGRKDEEVVCVNRTWVAVPHSAFCSKEQSQCIPGF